MGRVFYEGDSSKKIDELSAMDDKPYTEPNSLHITDDWDTMMEDYLDDFDDYQDISFPTPDDDI